jgi:hypothetical protein
MQLEENLIDRDITKPRNKPQTKKQKIFNEATSQPNKLSKWLTGTFQCMKCGKEFHTMTFGYGEAICPDCYHGEKHFLIYDEKYWLNRLLVSFQKLPNLHLRDRSI